MADPGPGETTIDLGSGAGATLLLSACRLGRFGLRPKIAWVARSSPRGHGDKPPDGRPSNSDCRVRMAAQPRTARSVSEAILSGRENRGASGRVNARIRSPQRTQLGNHPGGDLLELFRPIGLGDYEVER